MIIGLLLKSRHNKVTKLVVLKIVGLTVSKVHCSFGFLSHEFITSLSSYDFDSSHQDNLDEHNGQSNGLFQYFHLLGPNKCASDAFIMVNNLVACIIIGHIEQHYSSGVSTKHP